MRLSTGSNAMELRIVDVFSPVSPEGGDLEVECSAAIQGFSGSGSCWVAESVFKTFAGAVERLYERFEGSATLTSISPGELSLSLIPADSRGHVSVWIAIARITPPECSMAGVFQVDLPDLKQVLTWARRSEIGG